MRELTNKSTYVRSIIVKRVAIRTLLTICWHLSPVMAVGFVKKHVFRPAGYRTNSEENQILNSGARFRIEINGKTVQGWKWGEGPGILFVHGWNGRGVQFNRFFAPLEKAGYSVITFDAPAHGESSGNTSSYFEWTDTIRAILKSPHFDLRGIIGHSLGGSAVINALSKEQISLPTALFAPVFKLEEILFSTFDSYGIPEFVYRKAIAEYEHRFGYTMKNDNPIHLLPAVKNELLVVHDRQDRAIPFRDSKEIAKAWPKIILHETQGLGHRRILSDQKTVDTVVGYLIDGIESSAIPKLKFGQHTSAAAQFGKTAAVL